MDHLFGQTLQPIFPLTDQCKDMRQFILIFMAALYDSQNNSYNGDLFGYILL